MEVGTVNLNCEDFEKNMDDNWVPVQQDPHLENHTQGQPIQEARSSIKGKHDPNEVLQRDMVEENNHERTSKSFSCEVCNKSFSQKMHLMRHSLIHTGEKPYSCDQCEKTFIQKVQLKFHKRTHTGEKSYKCDLCEKAFYYPDNLNMHKRKHTGERPFSCDVCKKAFFTQTSVDVHMRIHLGIKPFSCEICMQSFVTSSAWKAHNKTLKHMKKFGRKNPSVFYNSLDIVDCNEYVKIEMTETTSIKKEIKEENMLEEELSHEEETIPKEINNKSKTCDICNKTFTRRNSLVVHKRIHTDEKPYACEICDSEFSRSSNLKVHIRMVHMGLRPYVCSNCGMAFGTNSGLTAHRKRMHNETLPVTIVNLDNTTPNECIEDESKTEEKCENLLIKSEKESIGGSKKFPS